MTLSDIPTIGDSTSVTYASPMKVATCAKFLLFHPRLSSRISMSKVSGNARESKVGHWIHNTVILFPNSKPDGRRISFFILPIFCLASAAGDLSSTFMNLLKKENKERGGGEGFRDRRKREKATSLAPIIHTILLLHSFFFDYRVICYTK